VPHAAFGCVEPPVARGQEPSLTSWASPELGQVASQEEFTRSEEHFDGELFRNGLLRREMSDLRLPGPHEEHTRAFEGDFSVHEGHVDTLLEAPDEPTERLLRRSEGGLDLLERQLEVLPRSQHGQR